MFASKAGAYPNEAPYGYSTLGQDPDIAQRLERLDMDKRSSLLRTFVNYGPEKIYKIDTWV